MTATSFAPAPSWLKPIILIRGFGGLGVADERRIAYQGFNDGTVYPGKRGDNYIYEGMILRLLKSGWQYKDATNVVGYYGQEMEAPPDDEIPPQLADLKEFFRGRLIADPATALALLNTKQVSQTVWVFRYYDLDDRQIALYGQMLVRLIQFIRALAVKDRDGEPIKVNVIAHSMGGLIARDAIQVAFPKLVGGERAGEDYVDKIVTLGTPHQGISFQILSDWIGGAADEIERFNPDYQKSGQEAAVAQFAKHFSPQRLLTVVGTNYRAYGTLLASAANRFFSWAGEYGFNYNRSDGLVKQASAQLPDAPRAFVHKCHGGPDSLVTSREAYEIAMRFFYGDYNVRLRLVDARVLRGHDWFGKSEFYLGVSIKPRGVDFDLFHQSPEAENCYGPFNEVDLSDADPMFGWAGDDRLLWEGWVDTRQRAASAPDTLQDLVMRLDVYVGERDLWGLGFSDNVVFRKQYYLQAVLEPELRLYLHTGERLLSRTAARRGGAITSASLTGPAADDQQDDIVECRRDDGRWLFDVNGTGFTGTFAIELRPVAAQAS
jgi:hypothetical protein